MVYQIDRNNVNIKDRVWVLYDNVIINNERYKNPSTEKLNTDTLFEFHS